MDLSIITVTWNSSARIANQIRSVMTGCRNIEYEHIIVDNNSKDRTSDIIKKEFPNVRLIQNKYNEGFSAANNRGIKSAKGKFILFLNPDMEVQPGTLDILVEWFGKNSKIGIAGCKLVDKEGNLNLNSTPRRFPGFFDQLAVVLKLKYIFPKILDHYLFRDFNYKIEQEVDTVQGSFMLIRREIAERLGYAFDPRYYIWFEDVDLCREAKSMGYKVAYTPIVSCVDIGGESFKARNLIWKQFQFIRSMIKYFVKWGL